MSEKIRLTARSENRLPVSDSGERLRFCPKCGRQISTEREICGFCEKDAAALPRPKTPRLKKVLILLLLLLGLLLLAVPAFRSGASRPHPTATAAQPQGTPIPVVLLE